MSDFDELDDFNDRVGTGNVPSGRGSRGATPAPIAEDGDEEDGRPKDARMWAKQGGSFFPCDESIKTLPPAQYVVAQSNSAGIYFKMANAKFDDLIPLPDSASDAVIAEIEKFWTKEPHFRSFGFLWKRGILLWGPPGSGKTCTLQQVSQNIIEQGGISVYADHPGLTAAGLGVMRRIEPERPIVVMMEDLDAMIQSYGEQEVLALLDGELQIDNVVFIATTNYPERLDKRIVNRPSRFDLVRLIDMPNAEAREVYLKTKNERLAAEDAAEELAKWVEKTGGYSIAHLKELIVSVEVFEVELDFALKRLDKMIDRPPKSTDTMKPTGQYN